MSTNTTPPKTPSSPVPLPLWREEFPLRAADERLVTRRQFAKFLSLTSLGMLAGNLWILLRARVTGAAPPPPARG